MFPLILTVLANEGDVFSRLRQRDAQALAELYDRFGGMAFRLILRIVHDEGVAEDLVQETFLRVWNSAHIFDSERGAPGPWLLAIARNRAIDYVRGQGRHASQTVELKETEHPRLFTGLPADAMSLDHARQVQRALEGLGSQQREAIELAYFNGMSQTEIARHMGQPLGTVKTWMRRALQQMRAALGLEGAVGA